MKKLSALLCLVLLMGVTMMQGAVFSTSPGILRQDSQNIKIFFDANSSGVAALQSATELYAHIGVTLAAKPTEWQYVKGKWSDNTADKKFKQLPDGRWELSIGSMSEYFGIKDTDKVAAVAVIARTPNGSAQTADFFIPVSDGTTYEMVLDSSPASTLLEQPSTINFTASVSRPSDITITVDGAVAATKKNVTELSTGYYFSQTGKTYMVEAHATDGSATLTRSTAVVVTGKAQQAIYPGGVPRQGAVRNADGSVTFCLLAPGKSSVMLIPSWTGYAPAAENFMKYQDYNGARYFWTTVTTSLDNSTYYPYYYLVDGAIKVADPCARMVLDANDAYLPQSCFPDKPLFPSETGCQVLAVYRGDIDSYSWDAATTSFKIPDHRNLNIYEMLIRDFSGDGSDSNGNSYGTFATAMEHIPYLKELGINAVEIMPVMEFSGNQSWGYNPNFYMALDKAYGTPRQMRDFVAECHRQGIAVILDIVLNHTDGLHPWYMMYPAGSNPFYNATAPHAYSVLNDWNPDNTLVEQHWIDALTYWLEAYKVDGFRFDLVKGLGDNDSYGTGGNSNTDRTNQTRVDRMKRIHAAINKVKPGVIHINELLGNADEENLTGADGQLNWSKVTSGAYSYASGITGNFGETRGFLASQWGRKVGETVDFAESHDEMRVARRMMTYGDNSVKYSNMSVGNSKAENAVKRLGALAAQMLLAPGSKMIWQFGELAADDTQGSDYEKMRPIKPKWSDLNNELRSSLHEVYRQMCNLRLKNPEMFTGEAECELIGYSNTVNSYRALRLTKGDKEIMAFFNTAVSGSGGAPSWGAKKLSASNSELVTASFGASPVLNGANGTVSVSLKPHEFAVFCTKNVAGIDDVWGDNNPGANVTVSSAGGTIVIEGEYTNVEVYNLQGMLMNSLNVQPGVYMVRVDGSVHKVLVR